MSIFLSWSGTSGRAVGRVIKPFLERWLQQKVYMSERTNPAGMWLDTLREQLEQAEFGVCLISAEALVSHWIPWEMSGISSVSQGAIYPIVLPGVNWDTVKDPIRSLHCFQFTQADLARVVHGINEATGGKFSKQHLDDEIAKAWPELLSVAQEYIDFQNSLEQVRRLGESLSDIVRSEVQLPASSLESISTILECLVKSDLMEQLAMIARNYAACSKAPAADEWGELMATSAWGRIIEARQSLERITSGEIPIQSAIEARRFWRRKIMGGGGKRIWTTNLPGGHGRDPDDVLIEQQRQAIESGMDINRVFVYRRDDVAEQNALRPIMKEQCDVGVNVFVIAWNQFQECDEGEILEIGSPDFMVVDDRFVYITTTSGEAQIAGVRFVNRPEVLRAAMDLSREIMRVAMPVKAATVNDFPDFMRR